MTSFKGTSPPLKIICETLRGKGRDVGVQDGLEFQATEKTPPGSAAATHRATITSKKERQEKAMAEAEASIEEMETTLSAECA